MQKLIDVCWNANRKFGHTEFEDLIICCKGNKTGKIIERQNKTRGPWTTSLPLATVGNTIFMNFLMT